MVDLDKKLAMRFICEAMNKAKEKIQKAFNAIKKDHEYTWIGHDKRPRMRLEARIEILYVLIFFFFKWSSIYSFPFSQVFTLFLVFSLTKGVVPTRLPQYLR